MFSKRRTTNIVIISIFCLVLLFGSNTIISNDIVERIRVMGIIFFPLSICFSIIFDRKNELLLVLKQKQTIVAIGIGIWILITTIFAIKIGLQSIKGLLHFGLFFLTILLMANANFSEDDKDKIKKALFISAIICVIYGIIQYLFGIKLNVADNAKYPGIRGRINSTFYIATVLDKYCVLIALVSLIEMFKKSNNIIAIVGLIFSTIGVTLTFSRTGQIIFVGLIGLSILLALYMKKFKRTGVLAGMLIIMLIIPGSANSLQSAINQVYNVLKIPEHFQINITYLFESKEVEKQKDDEEQTGDEKQIGDEKENSSGSKINPPIIDQSAVYRDYYNLVGKQFTKENPIKGIGIGNYSYIYNNQNAHEFLKENDMVKKDIDLKYPHSGYIQTSAEIGYIGVFLISLFFLSTLFYNNTRKDKLTLALFLFVFLLFNYTESVIYNKQLAYVFAIIYGFYACNITKNNTDTN